MSAALRPLPERVLAALEGFEPEGNPTSDTYEDLYRAFETFNDALFGGALEPVLISLRARGELGYFKENAFINRKDPRYPLAHEIALNPEQFGVHSIEMCLATLVRQQVHQIQYQEGTRGRRGYENKDFVDRMEAIGLRVRKEEEGKGKGVYKEKHDDLQIYPDGPFMRVARKLLDEGFRARWADRFIEHMRREVVAAEGVQKVESQAEQQVDLSGRGEAGTGEVPQAVEGEIKAGEQAAATAAEVAGSEVVTGPADVGHSERAAASVVPPIVREVLELVVPPKPRESKHKFQCPLCRACAWGKSSLHLVCGGCRVYMKRALPDDSHLDPKGVQRFVVSWDAPAGEGAAAANEAGEGS